MLRRYWLSVYDLDRDADESYDVAGMHPEIVTQMMAKVEATMKSFPESIQKDWEVTKQTKVSPTVAGALPRSID